jgi:hypothetical protein
VAAYRKAMASGQHPLEHHSAAEIGTIASWFNHTRKTLLHADANSLDLAPKPIKVSKLKYREEFRHRGGRGGKQKEKEGEAKSSEQKEIKHNACSSLTLILTHIVPSH